MTHVGSRPRFRALLRPSPLAGVTDAAWDGFRQLLGSHPIGGRTASGGYGAFDLRPRRLAELDVLDKESLHLARWPTPTSPEGRQVWDGVLRAPYVGLLDDYELQCDIFDRSMCHYDQALVGGDLVRPVGVSRAAALTILHRGGRRALQAWPDKALSETWALVERASRHF